MSSIHPDGIETTFVPERAPEVHAVIVDGEAVLLDQGSYKLHHLNPTATLVWTCFDGGSTIEEIAIDVSEALQHPFEEVLRDTLSITRELGEHRLLAGVEPTRWRRVTGVLSRRALDEIVVMSSRSRDPVRIAGSGPALWERLETTATVAELSAALAEDHDASSSAIAADVRPILDELERQGVVERVAAPGH